MLYRNSRRSLFAAACLLAGLVLEPSAGSAQVRLRYAHVGS
jgi:hypothetical protein